MLAGGEPEGGRPTNPTVILSNASNLGIVTFTPKNIESSRFSSCIVIDS